MICMGRIRKGPQDIEHRRNAQFFADRPDVLHGLVIVLGKEEAEPYAAEQLGAPFRFHADIRSQCFQHVGGAALGRSRPVAVLRHLAAAGGADKTRRRGNIERSRLIAAGSDDFQYAVAAVYGQGMGPHRLGAGRDLVDRRPLGLQRRQEGCRLDRRRFAAHNLVDDGHRFFHGQIYFLYQFYRCFSYHDDIPLRIDLLRR